MRMASLPDTAWAIEVSGQDLHLRLVRVFMHKRSVLRTASIPGFAALPDEEKGEKLVAALGSQAKWMRVFLSLPRENGIVRELQLPINVLDNLRSALSLQIEAISAWPEQETYWDYIVQKAKDNPKILNVTVVIIPKPVLDPWLQLFNSVDLPLSGATLAGLSEATQTALRTNVIPVHMRRRSARAQVVAAYVLVACLLMLGAAFLLRDPYQQRVYASQIQSEIARLEPQVKSLVQQESQLSALTKNYQVLMKHLQSGDSNLVALKTLATVLPPDTFLLSYRYQNDVVTISGASNSSLEVQNALEKAPSSKKSNSRPRSSVMLQVKTVSH